MAEKKSQTKRPLSADWLVHGVLTKLGDAVDRFTGRSWKPSSSLATSELIEKLKSLIDAEVRVTDDHRRFVPHNIKLKTQWDKFSTDSEGAIKSLETELLTALVDHINDRRYYTYAPISLQVKPDYFTTGVKLFASFDGPGQDEREVSLEIAGAESGPSQDGATGVPEAVVRNLIHIRFQAGGKEVGKSFDLAPGGRVTVGRTKESDVVIDDPSISKLHAAIVLNRAGELLISDTGSTNGTFIDGDRIAYGKAVPVASGQSLRFGSVDVGLVCSEKPQDEAKLEDREVTGEPESYQVGEFKFTTRDHINIRPDESDPLRTPATPAPVTAVLKPIINQANGNAGNQIKGDEGEEA